MAETHETYVITLTSGKPLPPARIVVDTSRYVIVDFGYGGQLTIERDSIQSITKVEPATPRVEIAQPPVTDTPGIAEVKPNGSPAPVDAFEFDATGATDTAPKMDAASQPSRPMDRAIPDSITAADDEPRLYVVVNGDTFPRPGLDTFFADSTAPQETTSGGCVCDPVVATYCSCNKVTVCRCVSACGCVGHTSCSCHRHTESSTRVTGCRCAPVH